MNKNSYLCTVKLKRESILIKRTTVLITFLMILFLGEARAQSVALRTNLAYAASLTPNLGAEVRLDSAWTIGANIGLNAWDIDKQKNKKWRHFLVSPNVRRYFGRHQDSRFVAKDSLWRVPLDSTRRVSYLEADLIYSHFNVGSTSIPFGLYSAVKNHRLQGDLVALGAKYGYSWILARDWRIEAEAGIAVGYAWFKEYDCPHCGTFLGNGDRIFLLPQLGINVVYIIN